MKLYTARPGRSFGNASVTVRDGEGPARPLREHTRHSPDGHAWGYGGSGPAQLALDMLWDVAGEEPPAPVYQAFKAEVIAHLDQSQGFALPEQLVRDWIRDRSDWRPAALA